MKHTLSVVSLLLIVNLAYASPTVYIPLGSANKVIAVDAATDKITATYTDVVNAHGHVMSTIDVASWSHHQAITLDGKFVLLIHGMRGNIK